MWQREAIEAQNKAPNSRLDKLHSAMLKAREIAHKHRAYKSYRTPHSDRRKGCNGILTATLQHRIGYRIGQGDGRHIESHAQGI